ncbi:MAG: sugar phosphate isomerase/epimerase [Phycisphaeraceae bacterium]|nr:sugar phosphate isomerase/epimerase [Phycisphaeraceae bacterium]
MGHEDIRIGTLVGAGAKTASYISQIIPHGFESFEITFGGKIECDPRKLAEEVKRVLDQTPSPNGFQPVISALGLYGNPLEDPQTAADWTKVIDACQYFGPSCRVVGGFAGCFTGKPVPEAIPTFKKVFTPLAKQAEDAGVKIAFENCDMGGRWDAAKWNIAHAPAAWEMMFNEVPSPALGLEWEPCHQMGALIDPIPQLRQWVKKIHHLHGKDATIDRHAIATRGIRGGASYCWHRHPGFGDSNWTDIISILRMAGFKGAIDIEGWHDPVYRGEMEMTGQVHAMRYLKHCRGGEFVGNPK